ncbi:MAG TPA: ATP synthase F1 subunit gamma [Candidatus Kapabacteria bacterium]|nr:ATP synthase F1 subunit gamma [Candidatus Kapabacteria bacterium]
MATLREIKRRIVGVRSTAKITQAMKMVAAAKLRRAQDSIIAARPYSRALEVLLKDLLSNVDPESIQSPLLFGRPVTPANERVLLIIITSDRGLAGAFNAGLIRFAEARIRDTYSEHLRTNRLSMITVGRRGTDYFSKRNYNIIEKFVGIFSKLDFETARELRRLAVDQFSRGDFDRVELVYNEFKSVISQKPSADNLLPILESNKDDHGGTASYHPEKDYIYEPSPAHLLEGLTPKHLDTMIWKALLESNAAEQGARMTAMDSATKNAKDLVNSLQLQYNKARQAAITKEILEIVGGAEALAKQ